MIVEKKNKQKILIIGLDGATLDLILPWTQRGYLPAISNLINNGSVSKMKSVLPLLSSAAWTTLGTGVNPGKHGIFDFVYCDTSNYLLRPASHTLKRVPTLWKLLSDYGKRVLVFNVPLTFPPEEINGLLVSGFYTPDNKVFTHPADLSKELLNSGYKINQQNVYAYENPQAYFSEMHEKLQTNAEIALSLYKKEDWDFSIIVFRETDDIAHNFWHYMDSSHPNYVGKSPFNNAILSIYKALDDVIDRFINASSENTNIFILSDHGSGPVYKDVYLNEWLNNIGYLVKKHPPMIRYLLSNIGLTRKNITTLLLNLRLGKLVTFITDIFGDKLKTLPKSKWQDFHVGINWEKTRAYSFGWEGQIFINLRGRESRGIVNQGVEYYEVRNEIIKQLYSMKDTEDDKLVVDRIYVKEEIYSGDALNNAPDIVVIMRDFSYITRLEYELASDSGTIFSEPRTQMYGGHRLHGVLIASGPSIKINTKENDLIWLGNITPTILHLFGLPIPEYMDGNVLEKWLASDISGREFNHKTYSESINKTKYELSPDDEDDLLSRLYDLGYL